MAKCLVALALAAAAVLMSAAPAAATYPGQNGKLVFQRAGGIWTVNPDGSGETQLPPASLPAGNPTWSPDGTRIAVDLYDGCDFNVDVCVYRLGHYAADGTDEQIVGGETGPAWEGIRGQYPTWSPDGNRLASVLMHKYYGPGEMRIVNLDGTNEHTVLGGVVFGPDWSPDGSGIAYSFEYIARLCLVPAFWCGGSLGLSDPATSPSWAPDGKRLAFKRPANGPGDIFVREADGSVQQLTTDPADDSTPAWSPDGTKIAFRSARGGESALWSMNADGSNQTRIPGIAGGTGPPDWQAVPVNTPSGYARPKGAAPFRVSLVPAFEPCTSPNSEHGPPLAFGSCSPPTRSSSRLVVGATDNLPAPTKSVGSLRIDVHAGAPGPPADTEVPIHFKVTNVMYASDFSDYDGELRIAIGVVPTDKDVGGAGATSAYKFPLHFTVQCATTPDTTIGGACEAHTSAEALLPGAIRESARAIWAFDQVRVLDGGNDGDVDTEPNFPFLTQGIFVP